MMVDSDIVGMREGFLVPVDPGRANFLGRFVLGCSETSCDLVEARETEGESVL